MKNRKNPPGFVFVTNFAEFLSVPYANVSNYWHSGWILRPQVKSGQSGWDATDLLSHFDDNIPRWEHVVYCASRSRKNSLPNARTLADIRAYLVSAADGGSGAAAIPAVAPDLKPLIAEGGRLYTELSNLLASRVARLRSAIQMLQE